MIFDLHSSMIRPTVERDGLIVDAEWRPDGVTPQFLDDAAVYASRYRNHPRWTRLMDKALERAEIDREQPLAVLDIGSGAGNTVFPLADLLPRATILASDISPQLLTMLLVERSRRPNLEQRIEAVCFDLHQDFFAPSTFDLIVGGAILHHMLDPRAALENAGKWLRPGGRILLTEPMELGAHMIASIYLTLEAELKDTASAALLQFFRAMVIDMEARFGVPRQKPWTPHLDDKWMFHEGFLRDMAADIGLRLDWIEPTENEDRLFENTVLNTLTVAELGDEPRPNRMLELLREFDEGMTPSLKRRFALQCNICLIKPLT